MILTTTAQYAIQILSFMAKSPDERYSSKILSQELNISYKYLAKIMTKLKKSEIITSIQGKYGGFILNRELEKIRVIDIIKVFDNIDNSKCILMDIKCNFKQKCILHDKWQKPRCSIDDFLINTTLLELIEDNKLTS